MAYSSVICTRASPHMWKAAANDYTAPAFKQLSLHHAQRLCLSCHSLIADLNAKLGVKRVSDSGKLVMGDVVWLLIQAAMAIRSYLHIHPQTVVRTWRQCRQGEHIRMLDRLWNSCW